MGSTRSPYTFLGDWYMRHTILMLLGGMLATSVVVACGDDNASTPTSPSTPPPSTPPPSTPPPSTPPPSTPPPSTPPPSTPPPSTPPPTSAPATAAVTVGDIFFQSGHNGSRNAAVDTVAVNGTVTWTWVSGESLPHSVQSLATPSFTSSGVQTGGGSSYSFMFTTAGTYHYNCGVHGNLMTGTLVVLAAGATPSVPTPNLPPPPTPPTPGY